MEAPSDVPAANVVRDEVVRVGRQPLRVRVRGQGQGRPLLLASGIGATGDLFGEFLGHLADRETIAFDAPGVGRSPAPPYPYRLRWYADVVRGLVRELGHERVDVLGLSWGGTLAQELAHRHRQVVRRLVLCATTPGVLALPGRPEALVALLLSTRPYSGRQLRRVAPLLFGDALQSDAALVFHHLRVLGQHPPTRRGYSYQLWSLRWWSSLPYLPRLRVPALLLAGSADALTPVVNMRLMARLLPDARLEVLPDAPHLFLATHAAEAAARVQAFLDAPR